VIILHLQSPRTRIGNHRIFHIIRRSTLTTPLAERQCTSLPALFTQGLAQDCICCASYPGTLLVSIETPLEGHEVGRKWPCYEPVSLFGTNHTSAFHRELYQIYHRANNVPCVRCSICKESFAATNLPTIFGLDASCAAPLCCWLSSRPQIQPMMWVHNTK